MTVVAGTVTESLLQDIQLSRHRPIPTRRNDESSRNEQHHETYREPCYKVVAIVDCNR